MAGTTRIGFRRISGRRNGRRNGGDNRLARLASAALSLARRGNRHTRHKRDLFALRIDGERIADSISQGETFREIDGEFFDLPDANLSALRDGGESMRLRTGRKEETSNPACVGVRPTCESTKRSFRFAKTLRNCIEIALFATGRFPRDERRQFRHGRETFG